MLRNETRATERRAQKASKKGTAKPTLLSSASKSSPNSSPKSGSGIVRPVVKSSFELAVIPAIQIPTETKATCHFVSNFILLPRKGSTRGFMDFLIPLMKTDPDADHLQHSFKACALASLGNRVSSDGVNFSEQAFGEYAKALRTTNMAIRDPKRSTSDSVLAAVLLLSLFEVSKLPITSISLARIKPGDTVSYQQTLLVFFRTSQQLRVATLLGAPTSTEPSSLSRHEGENSCAQRLVYKCLWLYECNL